MPSDLDVALEAAHSAAAIVRHGFGRSTDPAFKSSPVDPVTTVDRAAEEALLGVIRRHRPADNTLAEESGGTGWEQGRVWIADPLDGTVNFIHGLGHVAVSVALWEDGAPLVGVVIDVTKDETFAASAGKGATLNGRPIQVSDQRRLERSLVATGFPYDRQERAAQYTTVVGRVLSQVQGIRRIGSAALDLCYVACGRFDGYWETGLSPWDPAAALLLLEEAGGLFSGYLHRPYRLGSGGVIATNGHIHEALVDLVGDGT